MRAQKTSLRSTLRFSGLVTGAATALIGFGPAAHAEPVLTPEVEAALRPIIDSLVTGSAGSSGSAGSNGANTASTPPEPIAAPAQTVQAAPVVAPPVQTVQTVPTAPTVAAPVQTVQAAPTFALPAKGVLTSPFGDGRNHQGIDLAGPIGDPIYAASAGKVIDAGPAQGFGLWVRIQHADKTITTYGHNNENLVKVGDIVTTGQQIATIGNRGDSTGPHLHFEVKLPDGNNTDPLVWLTERGIEVKRNEPTPAETPAPEVNAPPAQSDTTPADPAAPPAPVVPDPVSPDPVSPDTLA